MDSPYVVESFPCEDVGTLKSDHFGLALEGPPNVLAYPMYESRFVSLFQRLIKNVSNFAFAFGHLVEDELNRFLISIFYALLQDLGHAHPNGKAVVVVAQFVAFAHRAGYFGVVSGLLHDGVEAHLSSGGDDVNEPLQGSLSFFLIQPLGLCKLFSSGDEIGHVKDAKFFGGVCRFPILHEVFPLNNWSHQARSDRER